MKGMVELCYDMPQWETYLETSDVAFSEIQQVQLKNELHDFLSDAVALCRKQPNFPEDAFPAGGDCLRYGYQHFFGRGEIVGGRRTLSVASGRRWGLLNY